MLAFKFETHAEDSVIKIPGEYNDMIDGDFKTRILKQNQISKIPRKQSHSNIKKLLTQIPGKNIFQTINDPAGWWRTIRNECP
jgi:hypothetical protein